MSDPPEQRSSKPKKLVSASPHILQSIQAICFDIDDTLSSHGKLTSEAFSALWKLHHTGYILVPITGRPAGWCDHIARFWPVDAVIGENGAFTFFMEKGVRKRLNTPTEISEEVLRKNLNELKQKIQLQFPKASWASDQSYREYDLAIDFCEDVPPWTPHEVNDLVQLCKANQANVKVSSIHVNTWFGNYDKQTGFEYWLKQGAPGCRQPAPSLKRWLYIGDSPNDEPMFKAFPYSIGVANLKSFLPQLKAYPTWITAEESGKGFQEMAEKLLSTARTSKP